MTFRIDDFKSEIAANGGFAMNNMFKVYLPPLTGSSRTLNILCRATSLPGRQIMSTERQLGIQNMKIANGFAVGDVNMTFYMTNNFEVREYFETWQNLAVNQQTQEIGYYNEYTHPVVMEHIRKGVSFPLKKKKIFDSGKLPSSIANRLPRLGPLDLAQGEIDLDAITGDDVTYTLVLDKAYPTTMNDIELTSDEGSVLEMNVQLSYKNWFSKPGDAPSGQFVEGLAGDLIRRIL